MNTITVDILEEDYIKIPVEYRNFMLMKYREPKDYDYSGDQNWVLLKKESNDIFKQLKKLELEIRTR